MNNQNFKVYVVGGWVRDHFLGHDPKDMDFVVVGATTEQLLKFGDHVGLEFKKVGADFPVFLDKFGNEWALARKERKTGPGYKGFECDFDPFVTIEEDLFRRDLTVNAMAIEVAEVFEDGSVTLDHNNVVDPFDGYQDLFQELLVHVSEHFKEDPVRVLRVARFAARYQFYVADHTMHMIDQMAKSGELNHLVPERVWAELEKALHGDLAGNFFQVLSQTEAMDHILPNFRQGWDDEVHRAVNASRDPVEKWALATHKMTPARVNQLNQHLKVPKRHANFALNFRKLLVVLEAHKYVLTADVAERAIDIVNGYRNSVIHDSMLAACCLFDNDPLQTVTFQLDVAFQKAADVGWDSLTRHQQDTLSGPQIGEALKKLRKEVLKREIP